MAKGKGKGKAGAVAAQKHANGTAPGESAAAIGDTIESKLPLAAGVKYRRILLKLSGEALMGSSKFGLDQATLSQIADSTRVCEPRDSSASCSASELITVASIPM